jgi:hypothetical protein
MEADRIALAIFGSFNDALCDELTHPVEMREVPKRTTSLIKRGSHCADLLVIKDGDVTSLALGNDDGCSKLTILASCTCGILLAG